MRLRFPAAFFCLLLAGGCLHRPPALDDYFPLAVGNEWIYRQSEASGTETTKILREETGSRGEQRFVTDGKGDRAYLRDRKLGLLAVSVSPGIWTILLREPLELGTRFDGGLTTNEGFHMANDPDGEEAILSQRLDQPMLPIVQSGYKLVTSLKRSVTVPAGTFGDCIEISHVAGRVVGVKYFAKSVGLVYSEAWIEVSGKRSLLARQELVRYTIAGEDRGSL